MTAPAGLLLTNGRIYTLDPQRPWAEALVARGDTILFVGDAHEARRLAGPGSRVIDLQGGLALPGFVDSHCHATSAVDELYSVMLTGLDSVEDYRAAIAAFLAAHPETPALRGGGWLPPLFPPAGPSKDLLDELAGGIPALLYSQDYHSAWANSLALALAGVDASTPDPPGGVIERLPDGSPSGTLRESAVELLTGDNCLGPAFSERPPSGILPPYTLAQQIEGLRYFQRLAHSHGITTVHIPHLDEVSAEIEALLQMQASGELRLRVVAGLQVPPEDGPAALPQVVDQLVAIRQAVEHARYIRPAVPGAAVPGAAVPGARGSFEIRTAKIFMDGVIEGGTAYLDEPYRNQRWENQPGYRGQPLWEAQHYNQMCAALQQAGFQIHVHAIGDAAVRMALDGIEYAAQEDPEGFLKPLGSGPRHGITHLQWVDPQDIPRFARLGVVAFVQPYWFVVDSFYDLAVEYLGRERADRQYPMRSFFEQGVLVTSSSDYPVTIPPRPLDAIQSGVTRADPKGFQKTLGSGSPGSLPPAAERVGLEEMIASFTLNGARAFFMDGQTGSLQPGKQADLVVLDRDIFTLPPGEIHAARVLHTIFAGEVVFSNRP